MFAANATLWGQTPTTAKGFFNRGLEYHKNGDYDHAIVDYTIPWQYSVTPITRGPITTGALRTKTASMTTTGQSRTIPRQYGLTPIMRAPITTGALRIT
jgi:hypothetical protein